jgi:hypothetical protein
MVRAVFMVCQRQAVPLYSSKYSKRDFTLWQHIALLALMQRMRKSYREYRNDFLTVTERLVGVLGLSKLPHFTTMEKFLLRASSTLLERVMGGFVNLTRVRSQVFSPDASGFTLHRASHPLLLHPEDQEGRPLVDEEAGRAEGETREVTRPRGQGPGAS